MNDWKEESLGNVISLQRGYDLPESERMEGEVPVIGSAGITGYHSVAKAKGPGITMGRSGNSIGKITYVLSDYWPHNACMYVKDYKGNDLRFVYYLLNTIDFKAYNSGGAQPSLNRNLIYPLKVRIPSPNTQRRIASILSAYDDLIENNLKRIRLLEEIAQRTYEEWFVKFRINGKQLPVDKKTGLPVGWERKKLNEMAEFLFGFPFTANDFNSKGEGTPIIRIRNIPTLSTNDFTTQVVDNKYLIAKGDLLVGMDGEFYINTWCGPEAYLVQRSCRIKAIDKLFQGYLTQAIVAPIKFFEATISGATVAHLGKKHLDEIEIVVPPASFKKQLEHLDSLIKQKVVLATQNNLLKESRDILLPRLMSGEIEV